MGGSFDISRTAVGCSICIGSNHLSAGRDRRQRGDATTEVVQGFSLPWLVRKLKLSANGISTSQQLMDARLALLAAANMYLDGRKSHGDAVAEIDYLRSHFRAQADSWLMRLNLDDESSLENQSPVCQRAFSYLPAFRR